MKTTVVPAQVTTVEDKIAGNLSFTQLLLLVTPVFLGGVVFVLLPPLFGFSYLKLIIGCILAVVCMTLAIRIKGKILLHWIVVIARYNARSRLHLFNKNDSYLRDIKPTNTKVPVAKKPILAEDKEFLPVLLQTSQLALAEAAISDPDNKFHVKTVKGGLRVYISKVEKEGV